MKVLLVGAGVIGTVYGTELARAGHAVEVLAHGLRTRQVAQTGLRTVDTTTGACDDVLVPVVPTASATSYDLVLVSVRAEQIPSVAGGLRTLSRSPVVLFLGNNPSGRAGLPADLAGPVHLGFPGIGGVLDGDTARYMRIPQQPTTLETDGGRSVGELDAALTRAGFRVTRTPRMDGWLAYHCVFVASVSAALYRCDGSAARLGANRSVLTLMCRAIEEGFAALARQGTGGAPQNLRTLHRPALRMFAVRYWSHTMRSPMGEQCFAAHARHARPEMLTLAAAAVRRIPAGPRTDHALRLLTEFARTG